jgi:hypothetical protein
MVGSRIREGGGLERKAVTEPVEKRSVAELGFMLSGGGGGDEDIPYMDTTISS